MHIPTGKNIKKKITPMVKGLTILPMVNPRVIQALLNGYRNSGKKIEMINIEQNNNKNITDKSSEPYIRK